jgi:hypothetical protein
VCCAGQLQRPCAIRHAVAAPARHRYAHARRQAQLRTEFFVSKRSLGLRDGFVKDVVASMKAAPGGMIAHCLRTAVPDARAPHRWAVQRGICAAVQAVFGSMIVQTLPAPSGGSTLPPLYLPVDGVDVPARPSSAAIRIDPGDLKLLVHYGAVGTVQEYSLADAWQRTTDGCIMADMRCLHAGKPIATTSLVTVLETDAGGRRVPLGTSCPAVFKIERWSGHGDVDVLVRRIGDHNHRRIPNFLGRHPAVEAMARDESTLRDAKDVPSRLRTMDAYIHAHGNAVLADAARLRAGEPLTYVRPTRDASGVLPPDYTSPDRSGRGRCGHLSQEESVGMARVPPPPASAAGAAAVAPAACQLPAQAPAAPYTG